MANNNSFQERFDRLHAMLYGFALKSGLIKEDAEDIIQEIGLGVYRQILKKLI